jgi:hypothetical protein
VNPEHPHRAVTVGSAVSSHTAFTRDAPMDRDGGGDEADRLIDRDDLVCVALLRQ